MKKITFLLLFLSQIIWAQVSDCIVYDDLTYQERVALGISETEFLASKQTTSTQSLLIESPTPSNYPMTSKKFRINFWAVRNDEGTEGASISHELAIESVKKLNEIYSPYQICFVLNGNGVLKSTSHMNGKNHSTLKNEGILKGAYADDAINVYVANTITSDPVISGITNYRSNSVALQEGAFKWAESLLAHEVGHALCLTHTFGNTNKPSGEFSGNNPDCEHVTRDPNDPNYNALTHGDYVFDTAADPYLIDNPEKPNRNMDRETCSYIGNQVDCVGTPYVLDSSVLSNVMAYGWIKCFYLITEGQARRIHYFIDNANESSHPIKRALVASEDDKPFDLMLRNTPEDFGVEPDTISTVFWQSPDIWVRNSNDTLLNHQNPEYGVGNNFVKVRILNKGCAASDGNGKLRLFWAKAGTSLPMEAWDGSIMIDGLPMGGFIGEADLPVLDSYEEYVFTFPWSVPNPDLYSNMNEPWHFCLLAKIVSPTDTSALPEDNGQYYHFENSNNIALHNVNIINNINSNSGKIHIGNFKPHKGTVKLTLTLDKYHFPHTNIFEEAEVKFQFDDKLWNIWQNGGFQGTNYKRFGKQTIIVDESTEIYLTNFPANDFGVLNVQVNFLTSQYTNNTNFGFNVVHHDEKDELVGGELYVINKNARGLFNAGFMSNGNAINADIIGEPATYNWYDSEGVLLHTGENYTVNNSNGVPYLLEVVSDFDGFKDMELVDTVTNNSTILHSIYPNPATTNVTIQYEPLVCSSAYIMLINYNTNAVSNYILDLTASEIYIDTNSFDSGLYRVVLVCDNEVIESHNLLIQ